MTNISGGISYNLNESKNNGSIEPSSCQLFNGDTGKCNAIITMKRISATLSISGCLFVLCLIVLFKKYKDKSQRLIANLAIASSMFAMSFLIDDIRYRPSTRCTIQGALITFFNWACLEWILSFVVVLYFKVVFQTDLKRFEIPTTVACWCFPVIPTTLGVVFDLFQPSGTWCWMKNDWKWRLGILYFWIIASLLIFLVAMIHIIIKLRRKKLKAHSSTATILIEDLHTLKLYPILYFINNVFAIAVRIHNAVTSDEEQDGYLYGLLFLMNITSPSYGATICVAYVLDETTRSKLNVKDIKEAWERWTSTSTKIEEYQIKSQHSDSVKS